MKQSYTQCINIEPGEINHIKSSTQTNIDKENVNKTKIKENNEISVNAKHRIGTSTTETQPGKQYVVTVKSKCSSRK